MYQGFSRIRSSPSASEHSLAVIPPSISILLANTRIGTGRDLMAGRWEGGYHAIHFSPPATVIRIYTSMTQHGIEFFPGDASSHFIGGVHDEEDGFRVGVVVFPERSIPPLARHVKDGEINLLP